MSIIPDAYYSRRMEESRLAMLNASDPGSRLAHLQLEAAYRILAQEAQPLPFSPSFQHGAKSRPAYGVASVTIAEDETNSGKIA
jgi:hypothetical protein